MAITQRQLPLRLVLIVIERAHLAIRKASAAYREALTAIRKALAAIKADSEGQQENASCDQGRR